MTNKEIEATPPPGKMVEVKGHDLHVYTEGEGDITIVFLSGAGTSARVLDFNLSGLNCPLNIELL